ncbi:MAG: YeeE/YedE thiosulfate transporter family protein, partial [Rhizobiaceae bacterium]
MEGLSADAGAVTVLCGFAGGLTLGFAARWGRFCTLKAIEDAALGSDFSGLRIWGVAIAVAIGGTHALDHAGLIDVSESFYIASPMSLIATVIGGLVFGLGIALVGTCGFGTLARMGGGDLKSVVTFLIIGISAYATLRGATAYVRVALFSGPEQRETPASFAHSVEAAAGLSFHVTAYTIAALLLVVCLSSRSFRGQHKKVLIGALVGLVIVWGWISTGVLAADDFDPYPLESYSFSAPLGETVIYEMTMSGSSLKFGIGAVTGVVGGVAATSLFPGDFSLEERY